MDIVEKVKFGHPDYDRYVQVDNKAYEILVAAGLFPQGFDMEKQKVVVLKTDNPLGHDVEREWFYFDTWQEAVVELVPGGMDKVERALREDALRDFVVEDDVLLEYNGTGKETVYVPEGIKTIGVNAFWGHLEVKEVSLPMSLETIAAGAFAGCGLKTLDLPEHLKIIEYPAFDGCRGLEEVRLPASLDVFSTAAFSMCESLRLIEVAEGNQMYFNQDEMVCARYPMHPHLTFLHTCPPGISGDVVLSGHVDEIVGNAFADCRKITSVTLPEGLRAIKEVAFYGCKALEHVEIPQSVKRIGSEAFAECNNLQSVVLPDSLESIGSVVFDGCKKLVNITVSDEALVRYVEELDLLDEMYLSPCYEKLEKRYDSLIKNKDVDSLIADAEDSRDEAKMEVLLVRPGMRPQRVVMNEGYKDLRKAVGGDIECVYPYEDRVGLVTNGEGKNIGLEFNRVLRDDDGEIYDIIAGNFVVVGLGQEDFASLSPELMEKYERLFWQPEMFLRRGEKIHVLPLPDSMVRSPEAGSKDARQEFFK